MIINPISKGGKGLLPEIIVTAPSGSTLDLMQGSVVLQTYTLSSTETQHTFTVKNTGTYTVRGTSGSDTASVEVVVDVIGRYECTIAYSSILYLYNLGDECEDVTGGWNFYKYSTYSKVTYEKQSDCIYACTTGTANGDSNHHVNIYPINDIDYSKYSKVCVELSTENGGYTPNVTVLFSTVPTSAWAGITSQSDIYVSAKDMTGSQTVEISCDLYQSGKLVILSPIGAYGSGNSGYAKAWIKRIWLE